MLFELSSGTDLWSKDVHDNKMACIDDQQRLAAWKEVPVTRMDQVFQHTEVPPVQLMVLKDLILMCLQGVVDTAWLPCD